jgi:hypothetical protein
MEKQSMLFDGRPEEAARKYTTKIEAPVYEPRHDKPNILALYDPTKARRLIKKIDASALPDDEKAFLRAAATRHIVFHYERIADYYAHSSPEVQRLMEESALVIIDFESAIEQGFVRLCDDIREQYFEEYPDNDRPA